MTGNYFDLLDNAKYITGNTIKNSRWRINNNLLGTTSWCPIVRTTSVLTNLLNQNIPQKIEQLKNDFPADIFQRATNYLYSKETRSSYEIEKEKPSHDRMQKFIALLMRAGTVPRAELLNEGSLVALQNAIVDSRLCCRGIQGFSKLYWSVFGWLPGADTLYLPAT